MHACGNRLSSPLAHRVWCDHTSVSSSALRLGVGVSCTHHGSLCQWVLLLQGSLRTDGDVMLLRCKGTVRISLCTSLCDSVRVCAPAASHTQATAAAVHPDIHSDPTADYRNLGLLQLLKKASRRRGGASVHSNNSAAQHSLVYAQTGQDLHSLGRAQSSLHSHAGQHGAFESTCLRRNQKPAYMLLLCISKFCSVCGHGLMVTAI